METYGLIGRKLGHSFSQQYFTRKFAETGYAAAYELFEIPSAADMLGLWQSDPTLRGLNVTIPYKADVIPLLDGLSADAARIGAVNTIKKEGAQLIGYNSDVYGFAGAVAEAWGKVGFSGALILGTGGAASAVDFVLRNWWQVPLIRYASRSPRSADQLAYADLTPAHMQQFPLIVNTTPLGTYPDVNTAPDLPYEGLGPGHYLFDLVYNPADTKFMQHGIAQGASVLNGSRMLVLQAEKSWEIWQGLAE